jgi:DNA-binding XRE family transcriptional regulator
MFAMASTEKKTNSKSSAESKENNASVDRYSFPRLKAVRLELGLTKEDFKTGAGVSRSTIDKAEKKGGSVTGATMGKMLNFLNKKLDTPLKLGVDAKLIK